MGALVGSLAGGGQSKAQVAALVDAGDRNAPHVFNVRRYGAVGNGVADDTAAIQAALDACGAAGGGIVYVPPGDFYCPTFTTSSGLSAILVFKHRGIWLRGDGPKSRVFTDQAAHLLWIHGCCNGGVGFVDGYSERLYVNGPTVYAIAAAARGDMSVTLATPGHAANFPVGARVRVLSGQLAPASANEPDAETKVVAAADAGTGVVTFTEPLFADHVQEYYVAGTNGHSSRTATANLAPFGIQNVTDYLLRDCRVSDLTIEQTTAVTTMVRGDQVENLVVERCVLKAVKVAHAFSNVFGGAIRDNTIVLATDSEGGVTDLSIATGSSDVDIVGNKTFSRAPSTTQINEGCAGVRYVGNVKRCKRGTTDAPAVQVGQRGRGIVVALNRFHNAGVGSVVRINTTYDQDLVGTSGVCALNTFEGGAWTRHVECTSLGWIVEPNVHAPSGAYGATGQAYKQAAGLQQPAPTLFLAGWLDKDNQTVTLGKLPAQAYVTAVHIHAFVAFNSDGTDTVSVGTDDLNTRFSNAVDVSTAGVKAPTLASAGYRSVEWTAKAYYVPGGTQPTAGKVLAALEYFAAPVNP